ncbi:hypothetical protein SCA6_002616 [Theobroma cacao]
MKMEGPISDLSWLILPKNWPFEILASLFQTRTPLGLNGQEEDSTLGISMERTQDKCISDRAIPSGPICLTNGVPCIVFHGVSGLAGRNGLLSSPNFSSLASVNALTVAAEFIHSIDEGSLAMTGGI